MKHYSNRPPTVNKKIKPIDQVGCSENDYYTMSTCGLLVLLQFLNSNFDMAVLELLCVLNSLFCLVLFQVKIMMQVWYHRNANMAKTVLVA